jgi:Cd2+/Zn2+-exporting ATPase
LAQAIVKASRAEGFEPHKAEGLKASWEKETATCLVCEDETVFVGKLEFIRENHEVSRRLKRLLNN